MTTMTTTITLTNDFHNTTANVRPGSDGRLSARQVARARRELCGVPECLCGHGPASTRGGEWRVEQLDGAGTRFRAYSVAEEV